MITNNWIPEEDYQKMINILTEVAYERKRQFAKWGYQDIPPANYALILGEEVGEVNKEIIESHFSGLDPGNVGELRKELIQVAAVAVQFVEWIDKNRTKPCPSAINTSATGSLTQR